MGRIGIEVRVKQGDLSALIDELLRQMAANEAIASGDEHAVHPSPSSVSWTETRRGVIRFRRNLFAASFPSFAGARKSSLVPAYSDVLKAQREFQFLSKLKTWRRREAPPCSRGQNVGCGEYAHIIKSDSDELGRRTVFGQPRVVSRLDHRGRDRHPTPPLLQRNPEGDAADHRPQRGRCPPVEAPRPGDLRTAVHGRREELLLRGREGQARDRRPLFPRFRIPGGSGETGEESF